MKAKRKKTTTLASKKRRRMRKARDEPRRRKGTGIRQKNPVGLEQKYLHRINFLLRKIEKAPITVDMSAQIREMGSLGVKLSDLRGGRPFTESDRKKNPKTARVAQKDITRAWGEYSNAQKVWGENNQVTQRALQQVYELKAAWEKQNPGRKSNPRKRGVVNRWGITVHVGDSFKVKHPHGDIDGPFTVKKLETSGAYAKAYGPRVIFEHGGSASVDDLVVTPHSYKINPGRKSNPSGKAKRYYCVDVVQNGLWKQFGCFFFKQKAVEYAKAVAKQSGKKVRVIRTFPSAR